MSNYIYIKNINMEEQFTYVDIRKLSDEHLDKHIFIRGRIHKMRVTGNMMFIVLRYQTSSLQLIGSKKVLGLEKFKQLASMTNESVIDCYGKLRKSPVEVTFTSYNHFEMDLQNCNIVSLAEQIPFQIDDANDFGETFRSDVKMHTKMENRWLDLRTPVNNSIFRVQSAVAQYFRDFMLMNDFIEIHSPKIIGVASEGGAQVFTMDYFDEPAFLAQSPQLYKQMAINSDFDRVFEVGPVFRAENSITARHMCEFIGLDMEMAINPTRNYREVQEMAWNMLVYIFNNLKTHQANEILCVREKIQSDEIVYPENPLIFKFSDCVKMLREDGKIQDDFEDLSTENEKRVGELVKEKFGSDLFIIDQYPKQARPFYTMTSSEDPNYTNSYDFIFKCTEIASGSQRIHDYNMLMNKVIENNINPETLKYYLNSFSHGSRPHGGLGLGLNRITSLFLNLGNVKLASFCPRDPKRLFP